MKTSTTFLFLFFSITTLYGADRYWRGTGVWDNINTANWAATPNGPTGASAPGINDNVIFDSLSAPQNTSAFVIISGNVRCKNLECIRYANEFIPYPGIKDDGGPTSLSIYGSFKILNPDLLSWQYNGMISFRSNNNNNIIDLDGNILLYDVEFNGSGSWTLKNDFEIDISNNLRLFFNQGTLNTDGHNITCAEIDIQGADLKRLNLGTSTINLYGDWNTSSATNFDIPLSDYTIEIRNFTFFSTPSNIIYNRLLIEPNGSLRVNTNCNINTLEFDFTNNSNSNYLIIAPNKTISLKELIVFNYNDPNSYSFIQQSGGTATIHDIDGGNNCLLGVQVDGINATSTGGNFYAYRSNIYNAATGWDTTGLGNRNYPTVGSSLSSSPANVCNGNQTTVTLGFGSGPIGSNYSYSWSSSSGVISTAQTALINDIIETSSYSLTVTDENNQCKDTKSIAVQVRAIPTIHAETNTLICANQTKAITTIFHAPNNPNMHYAWNPATAIIGTAAGYTNNGYAITFIDGALIPGAQSYTITATDQNTSCSTKKIIEVAVDTYTITGVSPNVSICEGTQTILTSSGATLYKWMPDNDLNINEGSIVIASPQTSTTYSVSDCNNNIKTVRVDVVSAPAIIASNDASICKGESTLISVTGGMSYYWTPVNALSSATATDPIANPKFTTTFYVTGINETGCTGADSVLITVLPGQIKGTVKLKNGTPIISTTPETYVKLLKFANGRVMERADSIPLSANGYLFTNLNVTDSFVVFVHIDENTYPKTVSTYQDSVFQWAQAKKIHPDCGTAINNYNVTVIELSSSNGAGTVLGRIIEGQTSGKKETAGDGIGGVDVGLKKKPGGQLSIVTTTDENGNFDFRNIPDGEYFFHVDVPGLPVISNYTVNISGTNIVTQIDFEVDSNKIEALTTTSIARFADKNSRVTLYPNPTHNQAYIDLQLKKNAKVKITLLDLLGRELTTIMDEPEMIEGDYNHQLNSVNLNDGIYILKILINNESQHIRFIKTK